MIIVEYAEDRRSVDEANTSPDAVSAASPAENADIVRLSA
jgi:hypothetical protein